jgi:hypothetical protein
MIAESLIHGALLAMHNIALVGCAAAPFYNRSLVNKRARFGPKLHYELDRVVEDTLQGNAPYCLAFIATLILTGIGMPFNHFLFHGAFRTLHPVAWTALAIKLGCVAGMIVIMGKIFFGLNPRLRALFARFAPGRTPDPEEEREFFAKRAERKKLCEICLKFAAGVLLASAFLGFAA